MRSSTRLKCAAISTLIDAATALMSATRSSSAAETKFQMMEATARSLNVKLQPFRLRESRELVSVFERMEQTHVEAIETGDDPLLSSLNAGAIAALAARGRLLSAGSEDLARAGGTLSYGVDVVAAYRHAALFVDKILKGANPADLSIEQAAKFQFILNLSAAKALGLEIPPTLLARADEVIE
jgi:putative tryptophan/tyrosine transport system substrate-binding protein